MISHRDYFNDVKLQIFVDGELIKEERFENLKIARDAMLGSLSSVVDWQTYNTTIRMILRQVHQIGGPAETKIYEIYDFTKKRGGE